MRGSTGIIRIIGAFGLVLISVGILVKDRETQDKLFIFGGICMELYSIWLHDLIFMALQLVFTGSATYDLWKIKFRKEKNN